ncbi:universal stress protein in QAH/OAS sulfhydrylase 3'region-like [Babylonia areolata]|uniref:universal stress protein in QAH/OAS sulfhydrylase 3'region-like n=1 Tax=Babylonia areolata TaxID=304850 RepID=UPI003FD68251
MAERKVFISVDGSKASDRAFKWYVDEVRRDKDKVYIVHVPEYNLNIGLPGAAADVEAITKQAKVRNEEIEGMLNVYMDEARQQKIVAQSRLLQGNNPGEAIIKSATEEGANMIIMGSRGLGKLRRTLLGSVSEYVVHHAPSNCSVTILRDS